MNQTNLIQCQVIDPSLKPILRENNEIPIFKKSLLIKFNSANISQVIIKLNQKPKNIIATLTNYQNQSNKSNQQDLIFDYFTNENQKFIYNSSINSNQFYTSIKIRIEQEEVGFFNIQLYGYEANKTKQITLDNFMLKPSQLNNENGTFKNFTDAISTNRDPAGRQQKKVNKIKLKQKQDIEEAIEKSLIMDQYEKINQKYVQESKKEQICEQQQKQDIQFEEDEELSLEILMQRNDLQQYSYDKQKQPKVMIENLGYTDKKNTDQKKGNHQSWNNNDPIKLHLMTKYQASDINQNFMNTHELFEVSAQVKKFLKNVMYN